MKNLLKKFLKKDQKTYDLHLITCTDTQQLSTSNVVQRMLDTAGVDYQLREGDSSFEWEFYVKSQKEFDLAQFAMADQGLWEKGNGLSFTFTQRR